MIFSRTVRSDVPVYDAEALSLLRRSGAIAATILQELAGRVAPGVSTKELNDFAAVRINDLGAKPAFLGYQGFPAVLCTSVNDVAVHGAPNATPLMEGDLLKLDFGVVVEGFYSDTAVTVPVGSVSREAHALLEATRQALALGIAAAQLGRTTGDIAHAIQSFVEEQGYQVVRELTGHGLGRDLHEKPQVPNVGRPGTGSKLVPGMVIAIEPITTMTSRHVSLAEDGFAYVSDDGSLAAHFEHTVAITENGPVVLTHPSS